MTIVQALQLAQQHQQSGRSAQAEQICRQILAQDPKQPDALHLLGAIAIGAANPALGAELILRAIAEFPALPDFHNNLGVAYRELGRFDEAIACFGRAAAMKPGEVSFHLNEAGLLQRLGRFDESIAPCQAAVALAPNDPHTLHALGNAFRLLEKYEEARALYLKVIAILPTSEAAHNNLGITWEQQNRLPEAIEAFEKAVRFNPNYAEARMNLGGAYEAITDFPRALQCYDAALRINPSLPEVHFNRALVHLRRGEFAEGWDEYEWRWKCQVMTHPPNFVQPLWDGSPLDGKRILLHTEQGYGDAIQFIRYAPLVAERGGQIILQCQRQLLPLLREVRGVMESVSREQSVPAFDVYAPIFSLPRIFRTTSESIPGSVPYLHADASLVERWRVKLDEGAGLKVGLAWAGNPRGPRRRYPPDGLGAFAALGRVAGVRFYSLQKDHVTRPVTAPAGMSLTDWTEELRDFSDTAALMANLDLIITVDTAVAHLAGALGRPTWTILPMVADWRWGLERADSPWYPTMRLFRQRALGDWGSVIGEVAGALKTRVSQSTQ